MLKRAGCKHIPFHGLRHTFATTALENGLDIKTLSEILGHSSAETTLNVYSHVTAEMEQNAAQKIDSAFGTVDVDALLGGVGTVLLHSGPFLTFTAFELPYSLY
jgi:hypothetical protein